MLNPSKHQTFPTGPILPVLPVLPADFAEMWALDGDKPVLAAKQLCRVIIRYFKGHGNSYQLDEVSAGPGHGLCRAGLSRAGLPVQPFGDSCRQGHCLKLMIC